VHQRKCDSCAIRIQFVQKSRKHQRWKCNSMKVPKCTLTGLLENPAKLCPGPQNETPPAKLCPGGPPNWKLAEIIRYLSYYKTFKILGICLKGRRPGARHHKLSLKAVSRDSVQGWLADARPRPCLGEQVQGGSARAPPSTPPGHILLREEAGSKCAVSAPGRCEESTGWPMPPEETRHDDSLDCLVGSLWLFAF
jgi:hypothetical protein